MVNSSLSAIAKNISAQLIVEGSIEQQSIAENISINKIYTDSRQQKPGDLFVALKGKNFDAHKFIPQVVKQGAKAVLVEKPSAIKIPQLIVDNSLTALGNLARFNRQLSPAKFVAVTGSSGKTTVKQMIASILATQAKTYATKGNLNNAIGVPLSLLQVDENYQFVVLELGANQANEIDYTAGIVKPDVALINNVSASHLQGFGSLQGVASAKGEIFQQLKSTGIAVINNDDSFAAYWKKNIKQKILTYARKAPAEVSAVDIKIDQTQHASFKINYADQQVSIQLPLPGIHQVDNALAAVSCCLALGVDLQAMPAGLSALKNVAGRMQISFMSNGCRVIDDTYNANLASTQAAVNLLAGYKATRILVLGDMAELGEFSAQAHQQIGELAKEMSIDAMYSIGEYTQLAQQAFGKKGEHFSSHVALIEKLKQEAKSDVTILIKGSRSSRMEKFVEALLAEDMLTKDRAATNNSKGEN